LGFEVEKGEDIQEALKNLKGTSTAHLILNRQQQKERKVRTLPGISNWSEWRWPVEGKYAGYILARALPEFGSWHSFSPAQILKLTQEEHEMPAPDVRNQILNQSEWTVPIYRLTGIVNQIPYKKLPSFYLKSHDFI